MAEQKPKPGAPKSTPRGFGGFKMSVVRERESPPHAAPLLRRRARWPWVLAALALGLAVALIVLL